MHFLYKLLNDDPIAKSFLQTDPGKVTYLKIDLDHYQFTDFKKERVTFGLKHFLTKTRLVRLLPLEYQRYFNNEKVSERFFPNQYWRRSDSEEQAMYQDDIINKRTLLTRQAYFPVINKESLESFIKQNKLAFYN